MSNDVTVNNLDLHITA